MPAYIDSKGNPQQVVIDPSIYSDASTAGLTVPAYLNRKYPDAGAKQGTAAQQIFMTAGLTVPDRKDPFALRPERLSDVLAGKCDISMSLNPSFDAALTNVKDQGSPFGSASRILFPAAVIARVDATIAKDRVTDGLVFDDMVGQEIGITNENFEQPVINYSNPGGAESVIAQRVAQLANPPALLKLTTADRSRRLAAHAIGMEISEQALAATTLDLVGMTLARFLSAEKDNRVYAYIAALWGGNADLIVGAVSLVTSNSLDTAATGGTLTHKAWIKFLARNRKYRTITHVVGDVNAYLAVEGRTGRPGSNNYDPTLARIDPQATAMNQGFGNNVKFMIVDDATAGGPVPANTIYAVDARQGITRVTNSAAAYAASEQYVIQRKTALRLDWAEDVYRTYGDTELRAFDGLTIS